MLRVILYIFCFSCLAGTGFAQLIANAGPDQVGCYNGSLTIGGTPSAIGGTPPYKYSWQPSTFLSSTTVANPVVSGFNGTITYTLTVSDKDTNIVSNTVVITLDKIHTFNAGIDTGYCFGQGNGVRIGAPNNVNSAHTFKWLPVTGLSSPGAAKPIATPSVTTIYTLTVSDAYCPDNVTMVTVTAFGPPDVNAGADTTIDEGATITLHGSGGITYWWQPDYKIKYPSSATPDVWPINTTVYTLYCTDQHGCGASDDVRVNVIHGEVLHFYSAFTPNNDGDNDFFYIGNLEKYPDNNLKIYNRYGKMIYSATNYDNTWNGTHLGNILPTGTYFYILNDGKDKLYNGSVTILR
ncbi:MAG: gliding motility-associated C-terminal protein [Bacteroidota bacterium]|jgi:gliding motility-associated-like protein|nr:gliding motility-associated C-terminal protein [Bacteroidota bacterium]